MTKSELDKESRLSQGRGSEWPSAASGSRPWMRMAKCWFRLRLWMRMDKCCFRLRPWMRTAKCCFRLRLWMRMAKYCFRLKAVDANGQVLVQAKDNADMICLENEGREIYPSKSSGRHLTCSDDVLCYSEHITGTGGDCRIQAAARRGHSSPVSAAARQMGPVAVCVPPQPTAHTG
jgi:hypothetical protein